LRRSGQKLHRLLALGLLVAIIQSCGPDLSEPNQLDISGRWASPDALGPVSNIALTLTQKSDGSVSGTWSANFFPSTATCPPQLTATSTGRVNGANTVLDVHLALLGVGDFRGQALDRSTLKGSVASCGAYHAVQFSLVGPIPPG
jgi:hypothetical protein